MRGSLFFTDGSLLGRGKHEILIAKVIDDNGDNVSDSVCNDVMHYMQGVYKCEQSKVYKSGYSTPKAVFYKFDKFLFHKDHHVAGTPAGKFIFVAGMRLQGG